MDINLFNQEFFHFLRSSPTAYHATQNMKQRLIRHGFAELQEHQPWTLQKQQGYFVIRSDTSLIAFFINTAPLAETGITMVGAHTDSPALKIKPNPTLLNNSYLQVGVELYGSPLLNPWFDRDLSLAGQVSFLNTDNQIEHCLIDFQHPIATIPSLAIHLDKEANKNRSINAQKDIPPILMQLSAEENQSFDDLVTAQLKKQHIHSKKILAHELFFYDTQKPDFIGINKEFIASARLDNLLSCFAGLMSLLETESLHSRLLVCNNHEEVGSVSESGANGPFLHSILSRLCPTTEDLQRTIAHSLLISADNAHGIHPNYSDKHDQQHGPLLNHGPVIKINANQRYASNHTFIALFKNICHQINIPYQSFVTRTDMACGSTIGPITAGRIGVKTLDIGAPTFAMHSIRELTGHLDAYYLYNILKEYFKYE